MKTKPKPPTLKERVLKLEERLEKSANCCWDGDRIREIEERLDSQEDQIQGIINSLKAYDQRLSNHLNSDTISTREVGEIVAAALKKS